MNDEVNPADLPLLLRESVQPGDYLTSNVANRLLYAAADYIESKLAGARAAHDELVSTADELAALSPVGQEPVCSISPYDLAKLQKHEMARVRPPGQGVPLYAAPPAAQAVDLPDDFSESKDWRESNYNGRVDWLKAMHASQRAEIVRLQNDVEILRTLIDQKAGKGGA
jgi:hypothetical protein